MSKALFLVVLSCVIGEFDTCYFTWSEIFEYFVLKQFLNHYIDSFILHILNFGCMYLLNGSTIHKHVNNTCFINLAGGLYCQLGRKFDVLCCLAGAKIISRLGRF